MNRRQSPIPVRSITGYMKPVTLRVRKADAGGRNVGLQPLALSICVWAMLTGHFPTLTIHPCVGYRYAQPNLPGYRAITNLMRMYNMLGRELSFRRHEA